MLFPMLPRRGGAPPECVTLSVEPTTIWGFKKAAPVVNAAAVPKVIPAPDLRVRVGLDTWAGDKPLEAKVSTIVTDTLGLRNPELRL